MKLKIKINAFFLLVFLILLACTKDPSPEPTIESMLAKIDSMVTADSIAQVDSIAQAHSDSIAQAQADSIAETTVTYGYLIDALTLKPIKNVRVGLYTMYYDAWSMREDHVKTVFTDENGYFKIIARGELFRPFIRYLGHDSSGFDSLGERYYREVMNEISFGSNQHDIDCGNIFVKPCGILQINLNKTGIFDVNDTLFLNFNNKSLFFLSNQANETFYYGIYSDFSNQVTLNINWNFKTQIANNFGSSSLNYFQGCEEKIFELNY